MALTMTTSGQFSEAGTKSSFTEITWENLMNECLINTKIFKDTKIDYEKCFDPNFVMDMRHRMFQQSSKTSLLPEMQIHSEALKILRSENHSKLLQKKESKIIEKEIAKLKQILENHRLLTMKEIDKITYKRIKSSSNILKFLKYYSRLPKRLEYYEKVYKVNGFLNHHVHVITETKNSEQKVFVDTKILSKKNEPTEEILETTVFNHKNSIIEFGIENEKHFLEVAEGNNEIIKTFFDENTNNLKLESLNVISDKFKIRKEINIQNEMDQEILKFAWRTWKTHTQQIKNKKREKKIYTCKIESFLSYLQERETKQEQIKHLKCEMSLKHKIKPNLTFENLTKIRVKRKTREEKEEKLKKLMQEVKTSQADTKKKLQEIAKSSSKSEEKFSNHKFLQKIEKRRQERLKCRKEIQEKKLKLKEEKEKVQREKERERNQKEKQIRLELEKKRRLEKEKKLDQKQKREQLKRNIKLAENHYETYLLRSCGWRPWATLLKVRDLQYQYAVAFYEKRVTQKILRRWMVYVKECVEIVHLRAENFYKSTLQGKCLLTWKEFLERKKYQDQVATDWNEFKITERAFKKWLQFTQREILEYLNKKETVKLFYERKLKVKSLKKIRAYPEFSRMEHAKKIRKQMWRQKIKEILPDFQPVDVSE